MMSAGHVEHLEYPAVMKQAEGNINGTKTNASSTYFTDKIMITLSQDGRLSQWIQVPLPTDTPNSFIASVRDEDSDLLPMSHLTPMTLLGAGGDQRETVGHLIASQIASAIVTKTPEETRKVLMGLGLQKVDVEREGIFDILELMQRVI